MTTLPHPVFVTNDPAQLTRDLVAGYEAMAGRKLEPAQVERLMLDIMAYEGGLQRAAIQDTGEQNLVRFARPPMLDYLGEMYGISRLPEQKARTTIEFSLTEAPPTDIVIPAGTRIAAKDGTIVFATDAPLIIKAFANNPTASIEATCQTPGTAANGFLPGEVSTLLDPQPFIATAVNLTMTSGGSNVEDDERLRTRILEAPHAFSVAGPSGSYRSFGLRAHPDVVDIAVLGPEDHDTPGRIDIIVLHKDGAPSQETLGLVNIALSGKKVRPMGDNVNVIAAKAVPFNVDAQVKLLQGADQEKITSTIDALINGLTSIWSSRLGTDIVSTQIVGAIIDIPGVYDVTLVEPATQTLDARQFAKLGSISITITGVENG